MGTLVAAYGVSHTAQMLQALRPDPPPGSDRVLAAWRTLGERLRDARPDAIVVVATEHFRSFFLDNFPTFCLGIGDEAEGWGDGGIPRHRVKIHSELARAFLDHAVGSGFDLSFSQELRLDHGFMTPLELLTPQMDIPVVPLFQNCTTPPLPTLRRCYELGRALRRVIEARPSSERVAVLGTGGLSHWLGVPEMGQVNAEFDRGWLRLCAEGRVDEMLAYSNERVEVEGGNGGQEVRNWVTMLGCAEGATGEVILYEPMEVWSTGIALLVAEVGQDRLTAGRTVTAATAASR